MSDALDALRTALAATTQATSNLSSTVQACLAAVQAIDLTPPAPVVRVVQSPDQLQAVLDGAGIVYVPAGTYTVDPRAGVDVRSRTLLLLHPRAELVVTPNGLPRYDCLRVTGASDVQIIGGRLSGDRLSHDYLTLPGTHEWGMGLRVHASQRVYARELTISGFTGDGISADGQDLTFEQISSTSNRRQGASFYAGSNYRILGGEYSATGALNGNLGTPPSAGIDFEPDNGSIDSVVIDGVTFRGNGTDGVLAWSRVDAAAPITNVLVIRSVFDSNANGVHAKSPSGKPVTITVLRNTFSKHKGAGVFVEDGASVTVGTADPNDANTFTGMAPRLPPKDGSGLITKFDIQLRGTGAATVGYNHYT